LGSLTAANWVSFDFNVSYSSCSAVVIPLNPEGMGIGEWVVLFSEIFEGMGMGMGMGLGNSIKLCASSHIFFLESLASRLRQKITIFSGVQVSRK